jgi:FKBP-type peptidyl-prolyl cis-trans isomerase FkpA
MMQQVKQISSQQRYKGSMRVLIAILFCIAALSSCSDNNGCIPVKPEAEEPAILAYAAANGITATKHTSGLYYQVLSQGSGPTPNLNSKVWVTYVGKHMDGTVFDQQNTPVMFEMNSNLIEGWKIGLALIQKGGHIKLIIPSSLAFGCATTYSSMPPNSILYFDIQLIDVQ